MIIGTSQRVNRLAKPAREQLKYVIDCRCRFGMLQQNTLIDMDECIENMDGTVTIRNGKQYWFFHDWALRHSYDTYQKMKRVTSQNSNAKGWRK